MMNKIASLRREIFAAEKEVTDDMIFMSSDFRDYLSQIATAITKRFGKVTRVCVKNEADSGHAAYTDDINIVINMGYKDFFGGASTKEKFLRGVGLLLHETLHMLFTNFKLMKTAMEEIKGDKLYPPVKGLNAEQKKTAKWIKDNHLGGKLSGLYHHFDNCIEDGHIETRRNLVFPGLVCCLDEIRRLHFSDYESYEKEVRKTKDKVSLLVNLVLCQAKFGEIKGEELLEEAASKGDKVAQYLVRLKPEIDAAVAEKDSTERRRLVNKAFLTFLGFIRETAEDFSEPEPDKGTSSEESSGGSSSEEKSSEGETSEEKPSEGESSKGESSEGESSEEKSSKEKSSEGESSEKETSEKGKSSKEDKPSKEGPSASEDIFKRLKKALEKVKDDVAHSNGDTDVGDVEPAKTKEGEDFSPEKELETIRTAEAEKIVFSGREKAILEPFQKAADRTRETCSVHRRAATRAALLRPGSFASERLAKKGPEVEKAARRATSILKREIQDRLLGDADPGYWMGAKFTSHEAWRRDRKVMSRVDAPEDEPDMEVTVLVDESGSMQGSNIAAARESAYMTYLTCKALNIPCTVVGHGRVFDPRDPQPDAKMGEILLRVAASPLLNDGKDAERIWGLEGYGDNNDGMALRACIGQLEKSKAEKRFLFVISDGAPCDSWNHYYRDNGQPDIRSAVKDAKRNGLRIITAGIGSCAEDIKELWIEGVPRREAAEFLEIGNLERLPKAFSDIIIKELS